MPLPIALIAAAASALVAANWLSTMALRVVALLVFFGVWIAVGHGMYRQTKRM